MLRQSQQLSRDDLDNLGTVFGLSVLDDMLGNIIAILVCDEHRSALVQLLEDASLVLGLAVLQNPLNDSASIRVGSENVDLTSESLDDELDVLSWNSLDGFLHNVVSVLILDTFKDVSLKLGDELSLLVS